MGKVKSRRQRLHTKTAKLKSENETKKNVQSGSIEATADQNVNAQTCGVGDGGVFSKLNIDLDMLTRRLNQGGNGDMDDSKSALTSKSFRGLNLTKKDKKNLKHQYWMKKIDGLQAQKQAVKAKKKRQKTAVVGDMKPLQDALPLLDLLMRDNKHPQAQNLNSRPKAIKKEKKRKQDTAADISIFHQVLKHPAFKKNPKDTISEHLQNKMEHENTNT